MTDDDVLRCSFCTKSQRAVAKLIAGPGVCICGEDVPRAERGLREAQPSEKCSFCAKTERARVYTPPAGWTFSPADLCICDECVKLCLEIIEEEASQPAPASPRAVVGARCTSCHAVLAETARTQVVDVPPDGDHQSARAMFLYCSACGTMLDDVILPID